MNEFGDKLGSLRPGQVWTIRQAPNPEARAIIGKLEPFKGRMVAHISVRDLAPPDGVKTDGEDVFAEEAELTIGHIPIALDAAADSLSVMISPAGAITPEFEDGYAQWKAAADKGQAGIFIQSLALAIHDIFEFMRAHEVEKE